jgi:hypothetical protein
MQGGGKGGGHRMEEHAAFPASAGFLCCRMPTLKGTVAVMILSRPARRKVLLQDCSRSSRSLYIRRGSHGLVFAIL